jgi:hypothetical protein
LCLGLLRPDSRLTLEASLKETCSFGTFL